MSEIKAIETVYNGYKFRSRLEARWAVFFDAAGIKYEYEPQGFELSDGTKYLPDFYLPIYDWYVEVKPDRDGAVDEINKVCRFVCEKMPVLLILGNIPEKNDIDLYHYPVVYYNKLRGHIFMEYVCLDILDSDKNHRNILMFKTMFAVDRQRPIIAGHFLSYIFNALHDRDIYDKIFGDSYSMCDLKYYSKDEIKFINSCYDAARQARFEHGETPKPNANINKPEKVEMQSKIEYVPPKLPERKCLPLVLPSNEEELEIISKYNAAVNELFPATKTMLRKCVVCDFEHNTYNNKEQLVFYIGCRRPNAILFRLLEGHEQEINDALTNAFDKQVRVEFVDLQEKQEA